jgi:cob(I)alamin adenosyltransferase
MKIYTRTGDKGETGLLGGARVPKHHIRIESYGTLDELNSFLGLLRDTPGAIAHTEAIVRIQEQLFTIGSHLAMEPGNTSFKLPEFSKDEIAFLEQEIDRMTAELPEMRNFVLPGGSLAVSHCHVARCVCRRAERLVVLLNDSEKVDDSIVTYLNRLSDYLFVLARMLSKETGAEEIPWKPRG